jgi:hypothetical protein
VNTAGKTQSIAIIAEGNDVYSVAVAMKRSRGAYRRTYNWRSGIAIVCRSMLGNKINREIVSIVASVLAAPGQRRGILNGYDSSRIHAPL